MDFAIQVWRNLLNSTSRKIFKVRQKVKFHTVAQQRENYENLLRHIFGKNFCENNVFTKEVKLLLYYELIWRNFSSVTVNLSFFHNNKNEQKFSLTGKIFHEINLHFDLHTMLRKKLISRNFCSKLWGDREKNSVISTQWQSYYFLKEIFRGINSVTTPVVFF